MNDTREAAVAEIAATVLHIDTLETQHSDRLDFHDVAVWSVRDALVAAYAAGVASARGKNFAPPIDNACR